MKKALVILAFVFCCQFAFAGVPGFENCVFSVNLRTEKVINGFYQKFENIEELKPVLRDFDQIFKENVGFSPRSDIRNLGGVGVTESEGSVVLLGYVEGKFDPTKILTEVEISAKLVPPVAQKSIVIREVGGKKVITFTDEKKGKSVSAYFFNNDLLIVGEMINLEKLISGNLKMHENLESASGVMSNEFSLWLDTKVLKNILEKNSNPGLAPIFGMLGMFNGFALDIERNDLKMVFNCADKGTAENLKVFIEGQMAGYRMFLDSQMKNIQKPGKEANWLPNAFKYLFSHAMATMGKKSLDSTKLEVDANVVRLFSSMPPIADTLLSPTTLAATGVIAAIAIPNFKKARNEAQKKACFANQRVLLGAVEMYNMDHPEMLQTLNSKSFESLVKEGYIKYAPECPTRGEYLSEGDLCTATGQIKCSKHGAVK